jgi:predicted nucleic acid-binding protein
MAVVVADASTIVAALLGSGSHGRWAERILASSQLAAPHLMPAEVQNIIRRAAAASFVSPDAAALAHADLKALRIDLFPYPPFADRIWELRANVTCYDAWYIALAEFLPAGDPGRPPGPGIRRQMPVRAASAAVLD